MDRSCRRARFAAVRPVPRLLGLDINASCSNFLPHQTALVAAATKGHATVVRWLLERGAEVNHTMYGEVRCPSLIRAASYGHLEVVKLLVEHGADVNATGSAQTPLCCAVSGGHADIAEFLRTAGATEEGRPLPLDIPAGRQAILAQFSAHRGAPTRLALPSSLPNPANVEVHACPPTAEWDGYAVFTVGLSDTHLILSETGWRVFLELVVYLPPDWPVTPEALADPKCGWPVEWLVRIAAAARESGRWPGDQPGQMPLVIANGEPPQPLGPGTGLTCVLCMPEPDDFGQIPLPDGRNVNVYSLYPLYAEERDLEKAEGTHALIERFQRYGISRTINPARKNLAK